MNLYAYLIRYLTALILLWKLSDKVLLIAPSISGQRVVQYLKSGWFQENMHIFLKSSYLSLWWWRVYFILYMSRVHGNNFFISFTRCPSNGENISSHHNYNISYIYGSKRGAYTYGWSSDLFPNLVSVVFAKWCFSTCWSGKLEQFWQK